MAPVDVGNHAAPQEFYGVERRDGNGFFEAKDDGPPFCILCQFRKFGPPACAHSPLLMGPIRELF